jgi:hypothetical protein
MVMTVDFLKALSNAYRLTARVGGRQRRGTASEIQQQQQQRMTWQRPKPWRGDVACCMSSTIRHAHDKQLPGLSRDEL